MTAARCCADGVVLAVKVTSRAGRSALGGLAVDASGTARVVVKVTAPPEAGRANEAVLALLAKQLGVPCASCRVLTGAASRWKRIHVGGDAGAIGRRLAALLAPIA